MADFAELAGLEEFAIFRQDVEIRVARVITEEFEKDPTIKLRSNVYVKASGLTGIISLADAFFGRGKEKTLGRRIHEGIMTQFNGAIDSVEKIVKRQFAYYDKQLDSKDQIIAGLKHQIELLEMHHKEELLRYKNFLVEKSPYKENLKIKAILERHPKIKGIIDIKKFNVDTSLNLSDDQTIIARLLLEIRKITNELRISKSKNLSLKNRLTLLFKNYYDDLIINTEVVKVKEEKKVLEHEKRILEGLSFEAKLRIDTLTDENENLRSLIAQKEQREIKPDNVINDLMDIFNFFSGIKLKQLLMVAGLVICLINFVNCISARTMVKKFFGFVLVPIMYALIYLLIKDYARK
jgi:hypothetical protein